MIQLPEAIMRAWDSDTQQKIGGWMQAAGIDVEMVFGSHEIKDHPWIGLEVIFPFSEVGKGKIVRCSTHPRGELMFDVDFPEPVPPIHGYPGHYEVVLKDDTRYHNTEKRFVASELKCIVDNDQSIIDAYNEARKREAECRRKEFEWRREREAMVKARKARKKRR